MVQTREIINYGTRYTTTIPDAADVFFPCQNLDGTPGHASANAIIEGVTQNVVAFLRPQPAGEWNPTTAYIENQAVHYTDPAKINSGTYFAPTSITANTIPPATPWTLLALDGKDGATSIARITNNSPGNSPAVGSPVTYAVDTSLGFAVGRYAGVGTLSGVFLVTALTATSITLQNVDAPVGSAVTTNSAIVPAGKPGTAGTNGVTPGHRYTSVATAPSANGQVQLASSTSLVIRSLDSDGLAIAGLSTTLPIGSQIWIVDSASTANRVIFTTTALPTLATNNYTITGTRSNLGTLPTTANGVRVLIFPVGASGTNGTNAIPTGIPYKIKNAVPGADGDLQIVNSNTIVLRQADLDSNSLVNQISNFPIGSRIVLVKESNQAVRRDFVTTAVIPAVASGNYTISVATTQSGTLNADDAVRLTFVPAGMPGTNGTTVGQAYVFRTGSTSPGAIRENGTNLEIHQTDRGNNDLTTFWDTLTPNSSVQLVNEVTPSQSRTYVLGTWSGSIPKTGGVYILPFSSVAGSTIADNINIAVAPAIRGLQGALGAGSTILIREIDGTPSGAVNTLEVPNSSLSDQGGGVFRLTFPTTAPGRGGLTYSTQSANANIAEGQAFITSGTSDLSFTAPAGTVAGQPLGVFRNDTGIWSLLMPSGATVFGSGNNSSIAGIKSLSAEAKAYAILKALAPNVWRVMDSEGIEFIASVVNLVPVMTANNAPSPFVASASSSFAGFDAFSAFDGNNSTAWAGVTQDTTPETLTINLGASKAVHYVTIRSRSDVTDQYPRDFTIQTSVNGTSFTTQLTLTNQVFSAGQVRTYTFPAPVSCQFVQVSINNIIVGGGYYKAISELGIFGTP